MFLKNKAKAAIADLEAAKEGYDKVTKRIEKTCVERFNLCQLIRSEVYPALDGLMVMVSEIVGQQATAKVGEREADIESKFKSATDDMKAAVVEFDKSIDTITAAFEDVKTNAVASGTGVVAGVGVATMAPTGLLAIATTFGTASTGTAISSLSGAAATNAALAWLGGGAVAAGGGGMFAGNLLLTLAGPVGWGIAAVSVIGGGLFLRKKNKAAIQSAYQEEARILEQTNELKVKAKILREDVKLNKPRLLSVGKQVDYITGMLNRVGLNDDVLNEIQVLIEAVKQLTIFMNKRISLTEEDAA